MRTLLFRSLINRPVTETAPRLDEGEIAELADTINAMTGTVAASA